MIVESPPFLSYPVYSSFLHAWKTVRQSVSMDQILDTCMHVREILCKVFFCYIASSTDDALLSHQSITCGQMLFFLLWRRLLARKVEVTDMPCGRTSRLRRMPPSSCEAPPELPSFPLAGVPYRSFITIHAFYLMRLYLCHLPSHYHTSICRD